MIENVFFCSRLPVVSDCSAGQTARVSSNLHPTSTMAVSRVPSPPPQEVNTPVAENWCYTQVRDTFILLLSIYTFILLQKVNNVKMKTIFVLVLEIHCLKNTNNFPISSIVPRFCNSR